MIIQSTLTERDFINANFVVLYRKWSVRIFSGIMAVALVSSVVLIATMPGVDFSPIIAPVIVVIALPTLTYFNARRNFAANTRNSEPMEYTFDADSLFIKGDSFNVQMSLDKLYKVTHTKNWLLIWQNRQIANPIPKRFIANGQLEALKQLLERHHVKNNL